MEFGWVVLAVYAALAAPGSVLAFRKLSRMGIEVEDRYMHALHESGLALEREEMDGPVRRVLRASSFTKFSLFINRTRLTTAQRIGLSVGAVTLFPVRLVLFPLCLAIAATFARLAVLGLPRDQVLTSWPRLVMRECMRFMVRAAAFSIGLWVSVRGRRAGKAEAPILVMNHYAFFDADLPPRLCAAPLSATQNETIPFVAAIMQCLQVRAAATAILRGR